VEEALLMATETKRRNEAVDCYMQWIRVFPLRPIRSDKELKDALAVVDRLLDQPHLAAEERDYLDVLGSLVERYEREHHPMPAVSDGQMLGHLIEAKSVTQAQVARATGIAESTISAVLLGDRRLNRGHIEKLARYFHVGAGAFLPTP
jgi:HTH-type transcriptional regulator / antitoxin HigA